MKSFSVNGISYLHNCVLTDPSARRPPSDFGVRGVRVSFAWSARDGRDRIVGSFSELSHGQRFAKTTGRT